MIEFILLITITIGKTLAELCEHVTSIAKPPLVILLIVCLIALKFLWRADRKIKSKGGVEIEQDKKSVES